MITLHLNTTHGPGGDRSRRRLRGPGRSGRSKAPGEGRTGGGFRVSNGPGACPFLAKQVAQASSRDKSVPSQPKKNQLAATSQILPKLLQRESAVLLGPRRSYHAGEQAK